MQAVTSFFVVLPWPPSINRTHRANGFGGVRVAQTTRNWHEFALWTIRATPGFRVGLFPAGCRVRVSHALVPPTAHALDLDNRDKAIGDALQRSGLVHNDVQIYAGDRVKYDKQPGGVHAAAYVLVERLPDTFGAVFDPSDPLGRNQW